MTKKVRKYFLFLLLPQLICAQNYFDPNPLIYTFNEGMVYWGGQARADYVNAMGKLIEYEEGISELYRIDPRINSDFFKKVDDIFANSNTRFLRFMFNCSRNRPEVAKKNNSYQRAWNMAQRQKSFFSRFYIVQGLYSSLNIDNQKKADILLEAKFSSKSVEEQKNISRELDAIIPDYSKYSQEISTIKDLQNSLSSKEVYLSFMYSDNARAVYVWKITKSSQRVFKLGINSSDLFVRTEMIKALMERDQDFFDYLKDQVLPYEIESYGKDKRALPFLNDGFDFVTLINSISKRVIKPLGIKNGEHLIIEIDQNLASLPFEALVNNNTQLLKTNTIYYTYSANAFLSKKASAQFDLKYLGFGYDNNGELLVANDEVRNASVLYEQSNVVINPSESEVYKTVNTSEHNILHFSTHSSLNIQEDNIEYRDQDGKLYEGISIEREMALLYGVDENNNGLIEPSDVFKNFNYNNKNTMLILSSCEILPSLNTKKFLGLQIKINTEIDELENESNKNGLTSVRGGCICTFSEPISALMSSFSAKGYKNIIGTKWKVDAYFANSFVQTFLRYYKREKNIEKALQQAQVYYMDDEPISNWSAFTYIKL